MLEVYQLPEKERAIFRMVAEFLSGRLTEKDTLNWALKLKDKQQAEKAAIAALLDHRSSRSIKEPWKSAWSLILESWTDPAPARRSQLGEYDVKARLNSGDLSGRTVSLLVDVVRPRAEVKPISELTFYGTHKPRAIRSVEDLIYASMTSGRVVNPETIGLNSIDDEGFLLELAHSLDAVVNKGLDLGRRIGWDGGDRLLRLGSLNRAYYVLPDQRPHSEHEPDEFHTGIAPSVKLLVATVRTLKNKNLGESRSIVQRWRSANTPVHDRMWCAMALDPMIADGESAGEFLRSCRFTRFWSLFAFPEVAELRSLRFNDLSPTNKLWLLGRIRRWPPKSLWPHDLDPNRLDNARFFNAVQEMKRLEIAGGDLPEFDRNWLQDGLAQFDQLIQMNRIDSGFPGMPKAQWVPPNPDAAYDDLSGDERLAALEKALSSRERKFDDDPVDRASDWIRQEGRALQVLSDLNESHNHGANYPHVWERFGWSFTPQPDVKFEQLADEVKSTLEILAQLPEETLAAAMQGVSHWLSAWENQIALLPEMVTAWLRIWPIAASVTDCHQLEKSRSESELDETANDDHDREALDALNNPTGRMAGIFLVHCIKLNEEDFSVPEQQSYIDMKNAMAETTGYALLVAKYRTLDLVGWFLHIDPDWAKSFLLDPLLEDTIDAIVLWDALGFRMQSRNVMELVGNRMADMTSQNRLSRRARQTFTSNLILDCMYSFLKDRDPSIETTRLTQMIRSLEDEIRSHGASMVRRFIVDMSSSSGGDPDIYAREVIYDSSIELFIQSVWPQEQSLTTVGVSRAFARLPAACGSRFAVAVDLIERFLLPFDCWSLLDFELHTDQVDGAGLKLVDTTHDADALLRLLDRTIGTLEGAVVPTDLSDALERVREVSPGAIKSRTFRRLATLAR